MDDKVLWIYIGEGAFLDGIPARDLDQHDWDRLDADARAAVESRGLYRRAARPIVVEAKPAVKESGNDAAAERAGDVKAKKE